MLGILAWLAFLQPSGAAAAFFMEGTNPAPDEALHATLVESVVLRSSILISERQAVSNRDVAAAAPPEPGADTRIPRLALAVLGALMLLFAAADGLRTRASYLNSQPAPGARLSDPPTVVRVTFGAALDPASSLSIVRLFVHSSAGEEPRDIQIARRLAPDDPERRMIEAVMPRLSAGLYRVTWQALPAWGGVPRHGSFSFGVGVPVPSDSSGITHSLQDRDADARGHRETVVGGVLLLVLGAVLLRFLPRT
ncbi:copper resistance protein CopC [Methyloglobulus sp.]|uniref:copper resistance CopC family protein n=1 Tax=Methyloglobulus sp. TaxID=2518622 RepID=UPI0039898F6D